MEPKFSYFSEKLLVGLEAKFISVLSPQTNNFEIIPPLWETFNRRMPEIHEILGTICYGVTQDPLEKKMSEELSYMACVEVTSSTEIPSGMHAQLIPAGHYAVFTHKGSLENLPELYRYIYKDWIFRFDGKLRQGPHLEIYDERFQPGSDSSEMEICVPIT